VAGCCVHG